MALWVLIPLLAFASASPYCNTSTSGRVDCGYNGINQTQCQAKGCCWSPAQGSSDIPWCFYQTDTVYAPLTVRIHYPDSKLSGSSISLRGGGCGLSWSTSLTMAHSATNVWTVTISCPITGAVEVKAMLSTLWQVGANTLIMLNGLKSGYGVDTYPWFKSQTGSWGVVIRDLYSPQLNNTRSLVIYTPPSYNENTLKQINNVLIMQDGQNLFDPATSYSGTAWMCQNTVDSLVQQGEMDEIIIVGVYNTPDRIDEYTYSVDPEYGGGKGDLYLDFLQQTVTPWVAARYRIQTDRTNMGIMGSSLGALISCYGGWTRPSIYGRAGCMSTSFWWNDEDFNYQVLVNYTYPTPQEIGIYLDSGGFPATDGDDYNETCRVRDHMEALGYTIDQNLYYYWDVGGQHSEKYWGARFYIPMMDLYPPVALIPSLSSPSPHPHMTTQQLRTGERKGLLAAGNVVAHKK